MRLLAVPNWSFGRNTLLLDRFKQVLESADVVTHYCESDVDHNRTVTAFSGGEEEVRQTLLALCDLAFDSIDLRNHVGVHPRVGALDVCPFVLLPSLRKGGFGSLIEKELNPDFGLKRAHPALGATICGLRDHLIAFNINFRNENAAFAGNLASRARKMRLNGDERFLGTRALGFSLASKGWTQLSINLTLPDLTYVDPIVEWARKQAESSDIAVAGTELIGVIRAQDLLGASCLPIRFTQVVAA
jgi:glutamate formiminotransferase